MPNNSIIDEQQIHNILAATGKPDKSELHGIIGKALELKGLTLPEAAKLIAIDSKDLLIELFAAAKKVKEEIYGKRLVIFAPLYISNLCNNDCLYCAFRKANTALKRRMLTQEEIADETKFLIDQGQKRLLLVAGEVHTDAFFAYVLNAINTVYNVKSVNGAIRRLNVNIAPLSTANFKKLHGANIGTYQIFQETYERTTYKKMHVGGHKADYDWRLTAADRAMTADIDDIGIGALFGLTDWRFEVLALLQHTEHLNQNFGIGPHTISVPRIEPAHGSALATTPPHAVSDSDFCKLVAILRLAVPYTGLIMSTRESTNMRRTTFELGISQISAGSRTNPGGYHDKAEQVDASQFSLGDHRPLDEVVRDIAKLGYIPSFCTACYRLGRVGESFMELAKSGKIKNMCEPNALITFQEYLCDYASEATRAIGEALINQEIAAMPPHLNTLTKKMIARVKNNQRDLFV